MLGEITLRVWGEQERWWISVADTGIGMDEEALQRIFEDFVQSDPSIARDYGGTGLGLALSKRLVEALGGSIEAKSQPEQGTTFTVSMPSRA